MKSTEKPQNPDAYTVNNTQNSQKKYKYKKGIQKWQTQMDDLPETESTYSRKLVTCVANKHASFANSSITNCYTLDEPWSTRSHWNQKQTKKQRRKER